MKEKISSIFCESIRKKSDYIYFLYYFYIREVKINSFLTVKNSIIFIIIFIYIIFVYIIDEKSEVNKIDFIHVIILIIEKTL